MRLGRFEKRLRITDLIDATPNCYFGINPSNHGKNREMHHKHYFVVKGRSLTLPVFALTGWHNSKFNEKQWSYNGLIMNSK